MSTPANSSPFGMELDSSYEVDYDIEITIKENIEKEILSVFEQGMHKYSFSTETIGEELKNILHNYKQVLFNRIIN